VGTEQINPTQIFIVPVTGGEPKRLCADFLEARSPIWTPDGRHLLFQGRRKVSQYEWWVAPIEGGEAVAIGVWAACQRLGLQPTTGLQLLPGAWTAAGDVIFSARMGDSTNLWRVSISSRTWKMTADPERVTFGAGEEMHPSVSAGGQVVFSSRVTATEIWSARVDGANGKVLGQAERITQDGAAKERPSLSADLKKLAFLSRRSGSVGVWVKDLTTGAETAVASAPAKVSMSMPEISKDGSKVAYLLFEGGKRAIYVVGSGGGVPDKVCEGEDCGRPQDWSSNGRKLLYDAFSGGSLFMLLDVASGQKHELARNPNQVMYRPSFSPDERWISFHARTSALARTIYVAPVHGEAAIPQNEWIAVTDGASLDYEPCWSPDGLIYFLSDRDGFRCIWALRPDAQTKRPTGPPFPVLHFHTSRRALSNIVNTAFVGLTVTRDRMIYLPGEITANIWMAEISR
jgi:Tol biopolymer transport system component